MTTETFGEHVRIETADAVATIVLERPARRNAVDRPTADALSAAFQRFEANPAWHAAVLFGAGGTFCAGADLTALADDARRNELHADGSGPGPMGPTRMAFSKPVIAAIARYAVAGGLELAAMCDLRVVEEDAVLGVFCRRVGIPLIDGGTIRLPRLIGLSRALDLILTGRAVDAQEALAFGLANRVVARGAARAAAEQLGGTGGISAGGPARRPALGARQQPALTTRRCAAPGRRRRLPGRIRRRNRRRGAFYRWRGTARRCCIDIDRLEGCRIKRTA